MPVYYWTSLEDKLNEIKFILRQFIVWNSTGCEVPIVEETPIMLLGLKVSKFNVLTSKMFKREAVIVSKDGPPHYE